MKRFMTQNWPPTLFGEGVSLEIGEICLNMGLKRILAVYDKGLYSTGVIDPILNALRGKSGIELECYDGIEPESPDYVVEDLGKFASKYQPDLMLAIGGGSTIDTSRAASMYCCCDNLSFEECQERNIVELSEEQINAVKLIFIPTTAGTGAETSGGGPLLNTKTNVKGGPFFGSKYSVLNILDPKLTVGLPPFLTYTTAMDALSHAIEGMSGKTRSPRTDMFCGQAVEYIWRSLPKVLENGADLEARGELLLAANLAIGVETLRHYAHAVAQPVGGMFHIAHGHTCALALPSAIHTIADNDQIQRELSLIAHKMGMNENSTTVGHDIADAITELNRDFGLKSLKEMGLNFEQIKQTIPLIMSDNRLLPNAVVPPTKARIEAILQNMYEY